MWGTTAAGTRFPRENPIEKVKLYREEIANLYCPSLGGKDALAAITGGAVLPFTPDACLTEVLGPALAFRLNSEATARYITLTGQEGVEARGIERAFPDAKRQHSVLMSPQIANELRSWLVEPEISSEQRERPPTDVKQDNLIATRTESGYRRIRGPAGSG